MKKLLKTLGERIRSIRGELNQTEFAEYVEVKQAMISRYESDKETPSPKTLLKIAQYSGKSMEWLLTGKDPDILVAEKTRGKKPPTRQEAINSIAKDISKIIHPDAKELSAMVLDLLKNQGRIKKVLEYHRFLKDERKN